MIFASWLGPKPAELKMLYWMRQRHTLDANVQRQHPASVPSRCRYHLSYPAEFGRSHWARAKNHWTTGCCRSIQKALPVELVDNANPTEIHVHVRHAATSGALQEAKDAIGFAGQAGSADQLLAEDDAAANNEAAWANFYYYKIIKIICINEIKIFVKYF